MKLTVVGTGYVGLVSGACFAELGNDVICVDIDQEKIAGLKDGVMPIYEPGLKEIVDRNYEHGNLKFTTSLEAGVKESDIIFIAVGTPSQEDGGADLSAVKAVAQDIAQYINGYKIVIDKSTVPVGTGDWVEELIEQQQEADYDFDVVSCPEFLREGSAVADTMHPDRVIIGTESKKAADILDELHQPFEAPILHTDRYSAEMIKYAANAFLATKISFINEIANICERTGGDVAEVAKGIGTDHRISDKFLRAGVGFGGACFPKDTKAITKTAQERGYDFKVVNSVVEANKLQKQTLVKKLKREVPNLAGQTISVLGLAFKPNTDDMREAPSRTIIKQLLEAGAQVKAYDPIAMEEAQGIFADDIQYCKNAYDAIEDTAAVILVTEWDEFQDLDLDRVAELLTNPIFIDGRNCYDVEEMKKRGFTYYSVGRPAVNNRELAATQEVATTE
ncbi:nucleotide sugar dehydrogenase [Halobacteroides halobius DSM 5150]|uniref:UDP-glucose 6-dehydrogenase n=1 Tax=Halobacteroides halobius (strain ATCC 35273 / DSM 5150 / MD-1) TaxID=748449 RepID=L0KB48_HALHC|nr:UDP-glucose/GDP-mannose dehydrogenase family protein [Halobacteroides halobius]AGB42241.1 nucleotide sugar dehydrogenase [Halobacteroides halobius DSM 5150]